MARPFDDQGRALLDAASRLLSTEGIGAVTVRNMAAEAGCSTMGVYSRFGGKDGVLEELYREGVRGLIAVMDAVDETDDPMDDLRRCALSYRRYALDRATHYLIVFGGAAPGFVPSEEAVLEALTSFDRLVHRVQRAQYAGMVIDEPAADLAEAIWGTIHGHVMLELVHMRATHAGPLQRYTRTVELLLRALQQVPGDVEAKTQPGPPKAGPVDSGAGGI